MARPVTFNGITQFRPGGNHLSNPLGTGLGAPFGSPLQDLDESIPLEKRLQEVTSRLSKALNEQFVGTKNCPQTRDAADRFLQQGMHLAEESGYLPPGHKITNVRIEGDTLLMDVQLTVPQSFIQMDFVLEGLREEQIQIEKKAPNLIRVSAPWKF